MSAGAEQPEIEIVNKRPMNIWLHWSLTPQNVSDYKLGTYKSGETLWHYIFAESGG
jgi:hypothetical protein